MVKKLLLPLGIFIVFCTNVSGQNIIITQSIMASGYHNIQDQQWYNSAISMGYNATIDSLSVLNDTDFFAGTDVLVLSEATHHLTPTQIDNIVGFVKQGKSAYIQAEYLDTFSGNVAFQTLMDSAQAEFTWVGSVAGMLVPMNILYPFSTTPYSTGSISYYWYGCNGTGCGVDSFLEYGGQYFGFYYHRTNNTFGRVITQSDQDWVSGDYDSLLLKNILYRLVGFDSSGVPTSVNVFPQSPHICNGGNVLLKASGASVYAWYPATGLNTTTGDSVIANPTVTTTYTVTGNSSCGGSEEVIVTVGPATLTVVPPSAIFCSGLSTTLTITTAGSDFMWSPSDGLSATTGASVIANPTTSVTYTVTGIDTGGCAATDTIAVTVNTAPNTNVNSILVCSGNVATLLAAGAYSYTWQPATGLNVTTGDSVIANVTTATTYTIIGADNNCYDTVTATITIIPAPNQPTFTQHGDTLTSSAKHDNQWFYNGSILNNDTGRYLIIDTSGWYYVVVYNYANGCSTNSDSVYIIPTGINQLSVNSNQLSVYPNPSSSFFHTIITLPQPTRLQLSLINVLGQTVWGADEGNVSQFNANISVANLPDGVYLLVMKTGKGVQTKEVVVAR